MIETKPYGPAAIMVVIECGPDVNLEAAQEAKRTLARIMPDMRAVFLGHGFTVGSAH